MLALGNAGLLCLPNLSTGYNRAGWLIKKGRPRTYISTTEPLDAVYTPAFRVASRFEKYFQPIMVTDKSGELSEELINAGIPGLPQLTDERVLAHA
jgi:hypothetical protein